MESCACSVQGKHRAPETTVRWCPSPSWKLQRLPRPLFRLLCGALWKRVSSDFSGHTLGLWDYNHGDKEGRLLVHPWGEPDRARGSLGSHLSLEIAEKLCQSSDPSQVGGLLQKAKGLNSECNLKGQELSGWEDSPQTPQRSLSLLILFVGI